MFGWFAIGGCLSDEKKPGPGRPPRADRALVREVLSLRVLPRAKVQLSWLAEQSGLALGEIVERLADLEYERQGGPALP